MTRRGCRARAPRARLGASLAVLLAAGCANIEERTRQDAAAVDETVRGRLGFAPGPSQACDDGAVSPEVLPLLQGALTEENAVKIALLNNRGVRAAYESLGIARADLVQSGLLANPVFSANAKFFSGGTEVELGLAQSFLDVFFIPLRRRAAEAELEAAKAIMVRDLVRLAYDVRRAFVEVRSAQQIVETRRRAEAAAQAALHLMASLQRAGNVPDADLSGQEATATRAAIDLAAAESAVVEAREPLNVLLGLWGDAVDWRIEGRIHDGVAEGLDLERVESRSIAASLDLQEHRAHIDAAAQRAGLSSWEGLLPGGTVGLAAKQESSGSSWGLGPSVGLGLPLFDHGQARSAGAEALLRQSVHLHTALAIEVRAAARILRERAVSLQERVAYIARVHLPVRERLVRETLQNYNAMQIGAFDVLRAKQQEIDAGREHLETLRDAWLARLDLEELLAGSCNRTRVAARPSAASHAESQLMNKGH